MRKLIRLPLLFVLFIALGLGFGYLTFKILSYSRTVEVPSLVNLSLLEANDMLSKAGLYLKIEGEDYDPAIQSGRIIRQDIPAGNSVKEKRSIKVIISKGPKVYSIPGVINETLSDAEALLLQKGLRITKVIQIHSDNVPVGKIVSQKPEPDDRVSDNITVLVSLGPHELYASCPDFMNKKTETAKETAEKLGLLLDIKGTGDIVVSQKPRAGTQVKSGDKISIETKEGNSND